MKVLVCCLVAVVSSSVAFGQNTRRNGTPNSPLRSDVLSEESIPPNAQPDVPAGPTLPGGTIALAQLRIPPKALKELQKASKEYTNGNRQASIEHLEKALRLYPEFAEGHNSLGLQYVKMREFEKALAEFRTASSLNPRYIEPANNRGVVLLVMNRLPEAESAARHTLDLDSQHQPTRYLLGRILAAENQTTPETLELLRQSRANFPAARLTLAEVLMKLGQSDEAANELRGYLRDPNATEKDTVARALSMLTAHASATPSLTPPTP